MWRDVSGTVGGGRNDGSNGRWTVVSSDRSSLYLPWSSTNRSKPCKLWDTMFISEPSLLPLLPVVMCSAMVFSILFVSSLSVIPVFPPSIVLAGVLVFFKMERPFLHEAGAFGNVSSSARAVMTAFFSEGRRSRLPQCVATRASIPANTGKFSTLTVSSSTTSWYVYLLLARTVPDESFK